MKQETCSRKKKEEEKMTDMETKQQWRKNQRQGTDEIDRERERECVCVCVNYREREREVCALVCTNASVRVCQRQKDRMFARFCTWVCFKMCVWVRVIA